MKEAKTSPRPLLQGEGVQGRGLVIGDLWIRIPPGNGGPHPALSFKERGYRGKKIDYRRQPEAIPLSGTA
jgi:hypothetical protein